ncbi:Serine-threonine/tyrosine-protein kinase, catalytic domain [Dillenia turbinata]|uniref:non-specific serine/threonine protein kinase n=1 Tax=Dillenia turbinata TaxID=194707 RepID=A0AAN8ZN60_9MAGN
MDMPGRRSNYTLLSQFADDHQPQPPPPKYGGAAASTTILTPSPYHESSHSGDKNRLMSSFDWEQTSDHRRIGVLPAIGGLQRQSSGSSFGGSSLSGEYYAPPTIPAAHDADAVSYLQDDAFRVKSGGGGVDMVHSSSSSKSWAQQTEESYQLQLALALRLSLEATCAEDPNFLDPNDDSAAPRSCGSPEAVSHRFWVNGCLSYSDKIPDGFYLIHGMDPYVWTVCTDLQDSGRIPSIEVLRSVDPSVDSSFEVVLLDPRIDPSLKELQNRALSISSNCSTKEEVVDQLAKLVCSHMGITRAAASTGEDDYSTFWRESSDLKDCLASIILPIGSLSFGLCRHRALLFKVLADTIDLSCRIAKGCKYCMRDDASSCLVRFARDREYQVDLIGKPGFLSEPDSLINGPSSISISTPLRFPRFTPVEPTIDFRSLAKQYFSDSQSLNLVFDEPSAVAGTDEDDAGDSMYIRQTNRKVAERNDLSSLPFINNDTSKMSVVPKLAWQTSHDRDIKLFESCDPSKNMISSASMVKDPNVLKHIPLHRDSQPLAIFPGQRVDKVKDSRFLEGGQLIPNIPCDTLDMDGLEIPWSDLVLKEKIGAGSFGTVHRAEWHGSDVAVKILMEQDFHADRFKEFLREVAIMKRLRHPNIVLFMGAVTVPPNLSIVTEYLARGTLFRLLHKPGAREQLDERRRLNMAFDVAKGMNYLHKRNPPIVHRDLKSPNLLVDKKYTVKVCDFGLSRLKANTFLSSKSAAGTPEWMAPEVLRDEPSNEKSDVYSFGVILWELATLQQPWSNLNPAQVVAAVGFKGKRPEIPRDLNPQVTAIIEACWASDPWKRPSFGSIMDSLRPLIKAPVPQPGRPDIPLHS